MIAKGTFSHVSPLAKICLLIIIVSFCSLIAIALTKLYTLVAGSETNSTAVLRMMLLIQNSCIFLLSTFLTTYLLWDSSLQDTLNLHKPKISLVLLGCLAMAFSGGFVDALNTWNQQLHLPESLQKIEQWMISSEKSAGAITSQMLNMQTWGDFLMNVLVIAILAGVGEELMFRGVLQRIFLDWTKNTHLSILITAFIFSAIHFQFFGFLPRMALGILLGYMLVWSRNLWVPIIAHTVNNFGVIMATPNQLFNTGIREMTDSSAQTTEDSTLVSVLVVVISIILTLSFLYAIRRIGRKTISRTI